MSTNDLRSPNQRAMPDRIDRQLLAILAKDARRSNKELAAEVGLAASTCHHRLRRLSESGVIRGFHADIEPEALGLGVQALLSLRLSRRVRAAYASLRGYLLGLPQVVTLFSLSGRDDFLAHVQARDPRQLRNLVLDEIAVRDEVAHVETMLLFEAVRTGHLPSVGDPADAVTAHNGTSLRSPGTAPK